MGYSLVWTEGVTGEEGTVEGEGVCLEDSTGEEEEEEEEGRGSSGTRSQSFVGAHRTRTSY